MPHYWKSHVMAKISFQESGGILYTMGREHHTTGGPGLQRILYDLFLYKGKFFRDGNKGVVRTLIKRSRHGVVDQPLAL